MGGGEVGDGCGWAKGGRGRGVECCELLVSKKGRGDVRGKSDWTISERFEKIRP